jgi:Tetratrico peptide repeat
VRRRRAVIQLASSLRNLGQPQESVPLLQSEVEVGSDYLDDAVRAFRALALVDVGQEWAAAHDARHTRPPTVRFHFHPSAGSGLLRDS